MKFCSIARRDCRDGEVDGIPCIFWVGRQGCLVRSALMELSGGLKV